MMASFTPGAAMVIPVMTFRGSRTGMRATRRRTMIPLRTPIVFRPCMSARRRGRWCSIVSRRNSMIPRRWRRRCITWAGRWRRRSGTTIMLVVPTAFHKIHGSAAGTIFGTVTSPMTAMIIGDGQINRGARQCRADRYNRIGIPQRRRHALDGQDSIVAGRSDTDVNINMNSGMGRQRNTHREE